MTKICAVLLVLCLSLSSVSCGKATISENDVKERAIGELATIECSYQTVAIYDETVNSKFLFFKWKDNKHFWMKYDSIVKIGIDMEKIDCDVHGDNIKITIPPAEILGDIEIDKNSLKKNVVEKHSADISLEDENKAADEAEKKLRAAINENKDFLSQAQHRAKDLLENYVKNLGDSIGKEYQIEWVLQEK